MKFGLLIYDRKNFEGNLGDQVQNIAVSPFLPQIDRYINREELASPDHLSESIFAIMNGWLYFNSKKIFPVKSALIPMYVSVHYTKPGQKYLEENPECFNYFRDYAPIGCRDLDTLDFFKRNNVEAYFSGCLTLTLDRKKFTDPNKKREGVFFVDMPRPPLFIKVPWVKEKNLTHKSHNQITLMEKVRFKMEGVKDFNEYKTKLASKMLSIYANARLMITNRLHVALPCLAFGTPVLFVYRKSGTGTVDDSRFGGLLDDISTISTQDFVKGLGQGLWDIRGKKTSWDNITNGENHREIADKLRTNVAAAIKQVS